jgi:hypothetical protein
MRVRERRRAFTDFCASGQIIGSDIAVCSGAAGYRKRIGCWSSDAVLIYTIDAAAIFRIIVNLANVRQRRLLFEVLT